MHDVSLGRLDSPDERQMLRNVKFLIENENHYHFGKNTKHKKIAPGGD
jgi:hypothetical protein